MCGGGRYVDRELTKRLVYVCLYGDLYIGRNVYPNVQITCDAEVVVSSVGGKAATMTAAFGNFAHYIWTCLNAMKQIWPIYLELYKNIPQLADSGYYTLDAIDILRP